MGQDTLPHAHPTIETDLTILSSSISIAKTSIFITSKSTFRQVVDEAEGYLDHIVENVTFKL